ncbi:MAG: hypothetical protein ABIR92_08340 [Gemmatimonadaceae bacterium]
MPSHHQSSPTSDGVGRAGAGVRERSDAELGDRVCHLAVMRELEGFQLGQGRADVRHWPVFTSESQLAGAIDRLMVQTPARRIRYACVLLSHSAIGKRPTTAGHVLVPIGLMRRFDDRNIIMLETLTIQALETAPRVHARPVTRGDENATLAAYGLPTSHDVPPDEFYAGAHFEEGKLLRAAPGRSPASDPEPTRAGARA